MAEKKTKKKTAKRKTRKKTTSKKKAAEAAASETSEGVASNAGETAAVTNGAETQPRKTGRKTAKRGKARKKPAGRSSNASETTAMPRGAPQIGEADDGAIVIEFPPVAPPPFAVTERPRAEERPPSRAPAPSAEARAEPRAGDGRAKQAPRSEKPLKQAAMDEDGLAASEAGLSPSQKRRLRRRRNRMRRSQGEPRDAAGAEAPEAQEAAEGPIPERAADEHFDAALEAAERIDAAEIEAEIEAEGDEDLAPAAEGAELEPGEAGPAEAEVRGESAAARTKRRRRRRRGRRSAQHEFPEGTDGAEPGAVLKPAEVGEAREPGEAEASGAREMIINAVPREECRIAILKEGLLEEIYFERATAESHVGNIYKGVVTNVEPSIQAAFIDFGQGKNGFLHISDLHPQYFPNGGGQTENVGHKLPRRHRPPIQRCLRRGQEVLVQVTKEGIGTKGPTLTTYLSIPGRFLVMMPGMRRLGVSRRIEDDETRDHLRGILAQLELPEGMGFIARTAAMDRTKRELQSDLGYLSRLWRAVEKRIKNDPAPAELYRESDLVIRTIRDVFTSDVARIVVDDADVAERAREFLSIFSPRSRDTVELYGDAAPLFHRYGIEAELERLHSRHVPLKSGGSLVIDQTEALVAIDVNSGRFRTEEDAEATAYKINVEAADEIPRQLRLRDLGGVVVCDFIDMRMESHRRDIERRLIRNLKEHKERAKVLRMSAFGMIELTRQRQRPSLMRSVYQDCRHCRGTGLVKTVESVALDVMRLIQLAVSREHINVIEVSVSPDVAFLLQNRKRRLIASLEQEFRRTISIRPESGFSLDQVEIRCTDARGRVVPHM